MAFAVNEDDERDFPAELIRWLADKSPDVWFATTRRLNWDNAIPVLQWIVSQPNCDKANAAMIFWLSEPAYYGERLARGEVPRGDGWSLVNAILTNWRSGFYQRAELAWPDRHEGADIAHFLGRLEAVPGAREALQVPPGLLGKLPGREPQVATAHDPEENPELWDLLYGLGTWAGNRPMSEAWQAERKAKAQLAAKRRKEIALGILFLIVAAGFAVLAVVLNSHKP